MHSQHRSWILEFEDLGEDSYFSSIHIRIWPRGYVAWVFPNGMFASKPAFIRALGAYEKRREQCVYTGN